MSVNLRTVNGEIAFAKFVTAQALPPATQSLASIQGQRYEKRVVKALRTHAEARGLAFRAGPWFTFKDSEGEALCVPDALLWLPAGALVVEVKLTYTPAAWAKLSRLYVPVVSAALGVPAVGLVICKHMARGAPPGAHTMREALFAREPVLQWLGHGPIPAGEAWAERGAFSPVVSAGT